MEFLQLLETVSQDKASVQALFGGEGRSAGSLRRQDPRYLAAISEAAGFIADVYKGRRPLYQLQEAMTTSDFPYLFGDVLDRQLLQNYRDTNATYRNWCHISTVTDFRTVHRFAINGAEATLAIVPEQDEYPESKLTDLQYAYKVSKYGRRIPFSWEAIMNDDLGALRDIPMRFGVAARRTEEKFATQLLAGAAGFNSTFFTVGNKNIINPTNGAIGGIVNPPLSIAGLQDGFAVLAQQKDLDGEPIFIDAVELIVPPALEVSALNILNATELWLSGAGGTATEQVHVANWMKNRIHLNVDYYLPIVSTTNGNTTWYMVASPKTGRPAFEIGFLRGHETPEVFIKNPNQRLVGGGEDAMQGDFLNDSIEYKVRSVLGGTALDTKMAVASNGSSA